jgi:ornithine carbamoyltransferase
MKKLNLKGRSFLKLLDFNEEEILFLIELSAFLKEEKKKGKEKKYLEGKNIALIFEKTSTRTRCAFEVASFDQGAHVTYLGPSGSQIGHKESIKDTARVLGRMYDGIEYRGFGQNIVEELAKYAGVPVWNGLTDEFHPTQIIADILTMKEHCKKTVNEISFCYLGDGRNNMANSLMAGAAILGMDYRIAAPSQNFPEKELLEKCKKIAEKSKSNILITPDIEQAVKSVDFLYTDVWVSMGEPASVWEQRIQLLKPYQVNKKVMELTGNPDVKFLHCLPAFHDLETKAGKDIYERYKLDAMEVTDDVFESEASIVFDEAENRMHTIKAVMVATLTGI